MNKGVALGCWGRYARARTTPPTSSSPYRCTRPAARPSRPTPRHSEKASRLADRRAGCREDGGQGLRSKHRNGVLSHGRDHRRGEVHPRGNAACRAADQSHAVQCRRPARYQRMGPNENHVRRSTPAGLLRGIHRHQQGSQCVEPASMVAVLWGKAQLGH